MIARKKKKVSRVKEEQGAYGTNGTSLHHPLRFIDLFCGIGGFRYAFEGVGAKCVFSSDWDKYSQITYEANFGHKPAGDIHAVESKDIPEHDILCGGFPSRHLASFAVKRLQKSPLPGSPSPLCSLP